MRAGRRWLATTGAAVLLAGLGTAPAVAAPGRAPAPPVPQLTWQACGAGLEAFQCATVSVPRDHDRPRGAQQRIALTRLPASDPARRIGSMLVNPGGPGGSGVDFVQNAARTVYSAEIRARYDIVGFDPRGVGRSDPATCFRTAEEERSSPLAAIPYPVSAAEERAFTRDALELAVRCQTTSPARFAHDGTANVARDLDLLRQALGDEKLTFYGYSYGTYLGAVYARLFPDRVGRFVLDGTVDPVAWTGVGRGDAAPSVPIGVRIRQGVGADDTFRQFARECREAGPQACPLAAGGDPAVTVPALFDRLLTDPVELALPDGSTLTITQQIAVAQTFQALYYPAQWADLAAFLQLLGAGQPEAAAAALSRTSTTVGARLRGEDYPSFGGNLASICVDAQHSRRPFAYPAIADQQDAVAPYFGRMRTWTGIICEFWALRDGDVFRGPWQQTTRAPVLVIGTRHDPATPYSQTRPYADLFPASRMLTVEGYGHTTAYPNVSTCASAAETAYLVSGALPADGAVCTQDVRPFAPAPQARTLGRSYLPPPPGL